MRYLSLFTGIGGFELGIKQAYESNTEHALIGEESKSQERSQGGKRASNKHGVQLHTGDGTAPLCVGYSEIDKYAIQIYQKHFPEHKNYGDITRIVPEELPDFDLIVGGFPCQSFSIAGKRGGFNDTRGTLFFDIARIIRIKKPRYLLLENVKGLLSHDGGKTFDTIIRTLDELGYDCQWQVLNSKNFGVPQNRERVFIIGHLRGTGRPKVFPIGEDERTVDEGSKKGVQQIANTLRARDYASWRGNHLKELVGGSQSKRVYDKFGISPTLSTMQGGNLQPKIITRQPLRFLERNQKNVDGEYSFTVDTSNTGGVRVDDQIRRLTPTECERLQGFPSEVRKEITIEICKQVNANSAETSSNTSHTGQENAVQKIVLISCVEKGVEIRSQGKLLLSVNTATDQNKSVLSILPEDFVRLVVGLTSIVEKITGGGKVESQAKGQGLTLQKSGENSVSLYGKGITQLVSDAKLDLTTLKRLTKSIISYPFGIQATDTNLITLFSCVMDVISGYIPDEIQKSNSLKFQFRTELGWTYGISDSQRYKTLGNAVTVNVIKAIMERLTQ